MWFYLYVIKLFFFQSKVSKINSKLLGMKKKNTTSKPMKLKMMQLIVSDT